MAVMYSTSLPVRGGSALGVRQAQKTTLSNVHLTAGDEDAVAR